MRNKAFMRAWPMIRLAVRCRATRTRPRPPGRTRRSRRSASGVTRGAAPGYVNDQACGYCHKEYASYQDAAMAKSFRRPADARVIEDLANNHYYHEPSRRHYEVSDRDGDYWFKRYQLDGEQPLVLDWLGIAQLGLGRLAEASLRAALEPARAEPEFNLSLVLISGDRHREAEGHLRRTLALQPNLVLGWYYLGRLDSRAERREAAVEAFRTALAIDPTHARSYLSLAETLAAQGRRGEARRVLQHAASHSASTQQVAEALAGMADG